MESVVTAMLVVGSLGGAELPHPAPQQVNWCTPGYTVMVPDGREGYVSSIEGDFCRIIADGEAYVSLYPYYIVEPVYPQSYLGQKLGH